MIVRRARVPASVLMLVIALAACDSGGLPAEDARWCTAHPDEVLRTAFVSGITPDDDFDAIQRAFLDGDMRAIARFASELQADRSAWERACREATDFL